MGWFSIFLLLVCFAWLGWGVVMASLSPSRGWKADLIFVFTWPIHVIAYWAGKE